MRHSVISWKPKGGGRASSNHLVRFNALLDMRDYAGRETLCGRVIPNTDDASFYWVNPEAGKCKRCVKEAGKKN